MQASTSWDASTPLIKSSADLDSTSAPDWLVTFRHSVCVLELNCHGGFFVPVLFFAFLELKRILFHFILNYS